MSSPTPASLRANHRASLRGKIVVAVAGTSLCAILVAALALAVDWLSALAERILRPRGL